MQFLVGLNESYAQTHGQIFLMDPLSLTSMVFSLVLQEERQCSISPGIPNLDPMPGNEFSPIAATSSVNQNVKSKKGKPICSHCNIQGHTVDKCYKLHGYALVHKFKSKTPQTKVHVNQTSSTVSEGSSSSDSILSSLTSTQC